MEEDGLEEGSAEEEGDADGGAAVVSPDSQVMLSLPSACTTLEELCTYE